MLSIQHSYGTSQPRIKLSEESGNEFIKSKWKNPEQESFFCWHLLAKKTTSNLLLRAVPLVQVGGHGLYLPQLPLPLWLTLNSSKDFRLHVLLMSSLVWGSGTQVLSICPTPLVAFQGKVPVTLLSSHYYSFLHAPNFASHISIHSCPDRTGRKAEWIWHVQNRWSPSMFCGWTVGPT